MDYSDVQTLQVVTLNAGSFPPVTHTSAKWFRKEAVRVGGTAQALNLRSCMSLAGLGEWVMGRNIWAFSNKGDKQM